MSKREQRLLKREEKFHNFSSGKTLAELIKERKEKDKEYNSKIFGNVVIGIHGKELPKFGQYNKIYWGSLKDEKTENKAEVFPSIYFPKKCKSVDITAKPNQVNPYQISDFCQLEESKYQKKLKWTKLKIWLIVV